MAHKSPYVTLAAAAVLFAAMVVVEDAAAPDGEGGDEHSEYGMVRIAPRAIESSLASPHRVVRAGSSSDGGGA